MNVRHEAHRVCVIVRAYPTSAFWVLTCVALAAGVDGNVAVLGPLLVLQLTLLLHMSRRMWSPPVLISVGRPPDQPPTLIPPQPGPHPSERRHRHARH